MEYTNVVIYPQGHIVKVPTTELDYLIGRGIVSWDMPYEQYGCTNETLLLMYITDFSKAALEDALFELEEL